MHGFQTDKFCLSPVFSNSVWPPRIENCQPWPLKISIYFQFTVHFRVFLSAARCLVMHPELWLLSLQAERRLWIYLLVHFNIHESPVLVQWAPPGLLTLLSCYKNPQSLWTMCLRNMNEARGPYIGCCRSLSISSTVCLCHLAQCTGRNTKQQRVIVEQSASKKKRRWRKMRREGEGRHGVSVQLWAVRVSCTEGSRDYSPPRNNCHSSSVPRSFFLFFLLNFAFSSEVKMSLLLNFFNPP